MNEYQYKIRAHHGMCLAFFQGKGYNNEFSRHMRTMKDRLEENPLVSVTARADVICEKCPNHSKGVCLEAERYDRQVLRQCGLSEGDVLSFLEFEKLVYERILFPGRREAICGNCRWSALCHMK
ncbi:MAG: DUF1284 domain-containing protein [Lachnospiraceae bacterium]